MTSVMCTGHRPGSKLIPEAAERGLSAVLSDLEAPRVISGGADGVDRLWARVAYKTSVPYDIWVPNGYQEHYRLGEWFDRMCHFSDHIYLTQVQMGEPDRAYSPTLNFTRNIQMIEAADDHVICSYVDPVELIKERRGGTRHAAKEILLRQIPYLWVSSLTGEVTRR